MSNNASAKYERFDNNMSWPRDMLTTWLSFFHSIARNLIPHAGPAGMVLTSDEVGVQSNHCRRLSLVHNDIRSGPCLALVDYTHLLFHCGPGGCG